MSENKRTEEVIYREYSELALKAGQLQYQIVTIQKDLDLVNEQMRALNFEAAALGSKKDA